MTTRHSILLSKLLERALAGPGPPKPELLIDMRSGDLLQQCDKVDLDEGFMDPAGVPYISGEQSVQSAGGVSKALYTKFKLTKFPDAREAIKGDGDAKFHDYGTCRIIHVVGPNISKANDAELEVLTKAYTNVFKQFAACKLTTLRMVPISTGIFWDEKTAKEKNKYDATALAFWNAHARLTEDVRAKLAGKSIKMYIFEDAELKVYADAIERQRVKNKVLRQQLVSIYQLVRQKASSYILFPLQYCQVWKLPPPPTPQQPTNMFLVNSKHQFEFTSSLPSDRDNIDFDLTDATRYGAVVAYLDEQWKKNPKTLEFAQAMEKAPWYTEWHRVFSALWYVLDDNTTCGNCKLHAFHAKPTQSVLFRLRLNGDSYVYKNGDAYFCVDGKHKLRLDDKNDNTLLREFCDPKYVLTKDTPVKTKFETKRILEYPSSEGLRVFGEYCKIVDENAQPLCLDDPLSYEDVHAALINATAKAEKKQQSNKKAKKATKPKRKRGFGAEPFKGNAER